MLTEQTVTRARLAADVLRRQGDVEGAEAVEALVRSVDQQVTPMGRLLTSSQAGARLGVTGQTVKNWVRSRTLSGYRLGGRLMIPEPVVEDYIRRAGASLDVDDLSDEEAVELVAEDRRTLPA